MDRSTRSLLSISALVLALFLAMNHIVQEAPLADWWLVGALLLIALFIWILGRERPAAAQSVSIQPPPVYIPPAAAPAPVPPPAVAPVEKVVTSPEPAPAAQEKPAASGKPDDLTVIEGIGPKMSAALAAAGINSFAKLTKTSEADLRAAIQAAGMRFAPSVPTWAEQAAFAVKGDWAGMKAFQDTLTGGRKKK